jgi:CheY-like chemotaxis protein
VSPLPAAFPRLRRTPTVVACRQQTRCSPVSSGSAFDARFARGLCAAPTTSGEPLQQLAGDITPELIVILSDIHMPGMDGLTLPDEVKRRLPHLPVMMITTYDDDERRRRAGDLGAAEFLTKPVDFNRLNAQLRQLPTAAEPFSGARSALTT